MRNSAFPILIVLVPSYAVAYLAAAWLAPLDGGASLAPVLAAPLIWLSVTDMRRFEIPDTATLIIALCGLWFQWVARPDTLWIEVAFACALTAVLWIGGGVFFQRTGREGLGIGDAKLIGAGALCTGFAGIWWALLLACLGGIAMLLAGRGTGRLGRESSIPFGPFLAYAIYMVFLLQFPGMSWH